MKRNMEKTCSRNLRDIVVNKKKEVIFLSIMISLLATYDNNAMRKDEKDEAIKNLAEDKNLIKERKYKSVGLPDINMSAFEELEGSFSANFDEKLDKAPNKRKFSKGCIIASAIAAGIGVIDLGAIIYYLYSRTKNDEDTCDGCFDEDLKNEISAYFDKIGYKDYYFCDKSNDKDLYTFKLNNFVNAAYLYEQMEKSDKTNLKRFVGEKLTNRILEILKRDKEKSVNKSCYIALKNPRKLFNGHGLKNLYSVELLQNGNTEIDSLRDMFKNCESLISVDLTKMDIAYAKNMQSMFNNCTNLIDVKMPWRKCGNVRSMGSLFKDCKSLQEINFEGINTVNVEDMTCMFENCSSLKTLNMQNFDTSKLVTTENMFKNCNSLEGINLNNFYTTQVTNMEGMFNGCTNLKTILAKNLDTCNVSLMDDIFSGCKKLTEIYCDRKNNYNIENVLKELYWENYETCYLNGEFIKKNTMFPDIELKEEIKLSKWMNIKKNKGLDVYYTDLTNYGYCVITINDNCKVSVLDLYADEKTPFPSNLGHIREIKIKQGKNKIVTLNSCFRGGSNIEKIDISEIDTSEISDMGYMFSKCSKLKSLDLKTLITTNVKDMSYMFYGCSSLEFLDIDNFGTEKATTLSYMFGECSNLKTISAKKFDTRNVLYYADIFYGCKNLEEFYCGREYNSKIEYALKNLWTYYETCYLEGGFIKKKTMFPDDFLKIKIEGSDWRSLKWGKKLDVYYTDLADYGYYVITLNDNCKISVLDLYADEKTPFPSNTYSIYKIAITQGNNKLNTLNSCFKGCSNLVSIDVSTLDTSEVTDMGNAFSGCSGLKSLNLDNFNTSNVNNMENMFNGCSSLKSLDLNNFNTSNVNNMGDMFKKCSSLESLDLNNFNTSNVNNMENMFNECSSLKQLNINNLNTADVNNMGNMFNGCFSLGSLDVSNFNTSKVNNMENIFNGCSSLKQLNISNFNTSSVNNMGNMFNGCSSLESLDLNNLKTSNVEDMSEMFSGCSSLISLNLESFDTLNVKNMEGMFNGCSSLTHLDISELDTSNVSNMRRMFNDCSSLESLNLMNFNTSNVENMEEMFNGCSSLSQLNVVEMDTSKVTNMKKIFNGCSSLQSLDVSKLDTSEVTNMKEMFNGCSSLESLDLGNFNTSKVTDMSNMFNNCSSIKILDVTNFDTKNVKNTTGMFEGCNGVSNLNLDNFETGKLRYTSKMFKDCDNLENVHFENFDASKTISHKDMFDGSFSLNSFCSIPNANIRDQIESLSDNTTTIYCENCYQRGEEDCTSDDLKKEMEAWIKKANLLGIQSGFTNKIQCDNFRTFRMLDLNGEECFFTTDYFDNENSSKMKLKSPFEGLQNLFYIEDVTNINRSRGTFTSTQNMFRNCSSLSEVDLLNMGMYHVENVQSMFENCPNLTKIKIKWGMFTNLKNICSLFKGCESIEEITDFEELNTNYVEDTSSLFEGCKKLKKITLTNFKTSCIKTTLNMFKDCISLENLNLNNFKINQDCITYNMFEGCIFLDQVIIDRELNEAIAQQLETEFEYIDGTYFRKNGTKEEDILKAINSAWYDKAEALGYNVRVFDNNKSLDTWLKREKDIDHAGYCITYTSDESSYLLLDDMNSFESFGLFSDKTDIKQIDMIHNNINETEILNLNCMFNGCTNLQLLDLNLLKSNETDSANDIFSSCNKLQEIKIWKNYNEEVCEQLGDDYLYSNGIFVKIDELKNFVNVEWIKQRRGSILMLDDEKTLINFCKKKEICVGIVSELENGEKGYLYIEDIHNNKGYYAGLFYKNKNLISVTFVYFNQTTINNLSFNGMFEDCTSLKSLRFETFDTSNVTDMNMMFWGCKSLQSLDLNIFNTKKVTNMNGMFAFCDNLEVLYIENFYSKKCVVASIFLSNDNLNKVCINENDNAPIIKELQNLWGGGIWEGDCLIKPEPEPEPEPEFSIDGNGEGFLKYLEMKDEFKEKTPKEKLDEKVDAIFNNTNSFEKIAESAAYFLGGNNNTNISGFKKIK